MAASRGSDAAEPAVLSRRDAIIGALALAAGALVASKPGTARASTGDTVTAGHTTYASSGTDLFLSTNGLPTGGDDWSYAMMNRNGLIGAPVQAFAGEPMPAAPAGSSGVWGNAISASHYGVVARHDSAAGVALKVEGKASFSRSGKATISKGHASKTVSGLNNITTGSIILVTLQGSAGSGNHVRWAKRLSATSFQVVLTKAASVNVTFGWLILN